MTIIKRRLTTLEADIISKEIELTPNIIYYSARELTTFPNCFVAISNKKMAGCFIIHEGIDFVDFKILIVLSAERNKGIAKELFSTAFNEYKDRHKVIYLTTRSPVIKKIACNKGFGITKLTKLPFGAIIYEFFWSFNLKRLFVLQQKGKKFPNQPPFYYYVWKN